MISKSCNRPGRQSLASLVNFTQSNDTNGEQSHCRSLEYVPAVEDRPGDLARVPPQEVGLVASPIDELEGLKGAIVRYFPQYSSLVGYTLSV